MSSQLKALLASYGRSFLAASLALWTTGNHDPKALLAAGAVAILPVLMRALNKKDAAFGLVAAQFLPEIQKQLQDIISKSAKKADSKNTK